MDPKHDAMQRALAASRLQKAWIAGDREAGLQALDELYAPGLRAILGLGDESARKALCTTIEVATSAVLQFWFGANSGDAWRELAVEQGGKLAVPGLTSNAAMLRMAGSSVVDTPGTQIDPVLFREATVERQARSLAHTCLLTDASMAIDYEALYEATAAELRPFLTQWLLASYLSSPEHQLNDASFANQRAARAAFVRVHGSQPESVGAQIGFTGLPYRAVLDDVSPREFMQAMDGTVFGPAISDLSEPAASAPSSSNTVAVMLECAEHGGKIDRRSGRATEALRAAGARGVLVSEDVEGTYSSLPQGWQAEGTDVLGLPAPSTLEGLATSAAAIRAEGLDALVYPHVSLGLANRWLSSQRLARVQISLAADGATSGSNEMDYIVVGEEVAGDGSEFSEQVLTVPGLGLDIVAPLAPREPRERPLDDTRVLLMSTATHDKLCGPMLAAWNRILERSQGRGVLHFFPSVGDADARRLEAQVGVHFKEGSDALLVPNIDRQELADLLVEGDVYLDTYPHGGLGALVEALCAGMPVVTLEGDSARSRMGAAILRRLGLPEGLIAKSIDQYVEVASMLVSNTALRNEIRGQLTRETVLETLFDAELPDHIAAAVQLARQLGPRRTQPNAPIRVPLTTDEAARLAG